MSKLIRLHKTDIEYLDYGWGIFSGCRNLQRGICRVEACWAKKASVVHKQYFPNGFEPTFYPEALESPLHLKKSARIGVGWMGDIIGYGQEYLPQIFEVIKRSPQHTFVFLTKNSKNLVDMRFPQNCWVGQSLTGTEYDLADRLRCFTDTQATVKFISFEPLRKMPELKGTFVNKVGKWYTWGDIIDWIVIGGQTRPSVMPKLEWILNLVDEADKLNKKVFLKNNLMPLISGLEISCPKMEGRILNTLYEGDKLRQEFPL